MTGIFVVGATLAAPLVLSLRLLEKPWGGIVAGVAACLWFSVFMAIIIWLDTRDDA